MDTGAPPFGDADDAEHRVRAWADGLSARAERWAELSARVAEVTEDGASPDGAVRVRVGASGQLVDLQLAPHAADRAPHRLAAEVLDLVRAAQGGLAARVADVAAGTVGDEDPATVSAIVGSYAHRFPPAEAPARPARSDPDEDDGGGVLRPV